MEGGGNLVRKTLHCLVFQKSEVRPCRALCVPRTYAITMSLMYTGWFHPRPSCGRRKQPAAAHGNVRAIVPHRTTGFISSLVMINHLVGIWFKFHMRYCWEKNSTQNERLEGRKRIYLHRSFT